ncbi:MAG TPA: stalk domain-containing protein, partial [Symbiobacteriaceae bacterium]|nr:stalk domain-containing protein [Symbiobacteriaceae bacterium]
MASSWMRRVTAATAAGVLVLGLAATSAVAAPKGDNPGQGSKNSAVESGKPESQVTETVAPETAVDENLPACTPAPDEPVVEEPVTEEPATEAPATEEPATEEPATETPADEDTETEEPADPCAPPAETPGNGVNLTGRGKSAEKNPNVDADGNLIPGAASGKTESGDETEAADEAEGDEATAGEEVKTAKIAKVKANSRAQAKAERANGEKGAYLVYVNGERLNLTPLARNGSTLVPFRRLAEFLGATVTWEPEGQKVIMEKGDSKVEITIGSATAVVDGETVEMPVPTELVEGSTFVPLRFIATALGADVDYDAETGAITVITTDESDDTEETEEPETETPVEGTEPATETPV